MNQLSNVYYFRLILLAGLYIYSNVVSAQLTSDSVKYYTNQLHEKHTSLERARLQIKLARFLSETGESGQATRLTFTAIEVFKQNQSYKDLVQAYTNLAQIFHFEHNPDKPTQYGKIALDYARRSGDTSQICRTMQNYAMALGENGRFDESLSYFREVLTLATTRKDSASLMLTYLNAASILVEKGDYQQTITYARQGLLLATRRNLTDEILRAEAIIGAAFTRLGRFSDADSHFKRAEALLPAIGSLFFDREMAFIRTQWAEKQQNFKAAYAYHKSYYTLDTSLANQASRQKIAELEVRYKVRENEQSKARLEQELVYQRWLFTGGALLFMLILAVIYLQRKQLRNRNQLLEAREKMTALHLQTATEQLSFFADSVVRKNAFIDQISSELDQLKAREIQVSDGLVEQLNQARMLTDAQWDDFRLKFEQLHPRFIDRLRGLVPGLTDTELKMACMIRLHFSAGQMAGMLGISADSIKKNRYRLRKKIDTEELSAFLSAV